jgi:predicted AlkP superfamily phosphohydrolase/phosphomutase
VFENDTGPDDANHAHAGLYVLVADDVPTGPGPERAIHDVAPTLLELLGEPVPAEMEGQSMLRARAATAPG